MSSVAEGGWAVGYSSRDYDVEDPAETEQDENDWPVILVRHSDGQRYAVEVMVTVNPLPALIDEQQCSPEAMAKRWPRTPSSRPLELMDERCCACSLPLIAGWISKGGAHADCEHLARMRASHPEWFADTADQAALPLEIGGTA